MKAKLLTDGRYNFMVGLDYPITVECELSPNKTNVAVTPEQLEAAGIQNVPTRFVCKVWYWTLGIEAIITKE